MKMHSGVAGDGKAVAAAKEVTSLPANEIKARIPHQDVAISEEMNGTEYGLPCRLWKYRHFVKKFFILFGKPQRRGGVETRSALKHQSSRKEFPISKIQLRPLLQEEYGVYRTIPDKKIQKLVRARQLWLQLLAATRRCSGMKR